MAFRLSPLVARLSLNLWSTTRWAAYGGTTSMPLLVRWILPRFKALRRSLHHVHLSDQKRRWSLFHRSVYQSAVDTASGILAVSAVR